MGACHGNNLSFFHQEVVGSVATCQTWDAVKYKEVGRFDMSGEGRGRRRMGNEGSPYSNLQNVLSIVR